MKHLRQYDYSEAFEALLKKAKVQLEHPLLSQLHTLLVGLALSARCVVLRSRVFMLFQVEKGDFGAVERVMEKAAEGLSD